MFVKDLIRILETVDGDLPIFIEMNHIEQGYILKQPNIGNDTYKEVTEQFRDAFDGETYTSTVLTSGDKNDKACILIV